MLHCGTPEVTGKSDEVDGGALKSGKKIALA